ncbi:hypothetical protein NIBR502774_19095 (plasmid) [Rhizobium sp. NIBRBAC000502774]|nr:hypothetical protein NIBR502774_19095 [Rhizobium sp. NIBRBAC000502774]
MISTKDIIDIADCLSSNKFTSIEWHSNGVSLLMELSAGSSNSQAATPLEDERVLEPTMQIVSSSFGNFSFHCLNDESPILAVGNTVQDGDLVGLLGVGEVVFPVHSNSSGLVTAVYVEEGCLVEFRQNIAELSLN